MKIILSRKGFDSSSGGVPSPLFPDGTLFSLPIPDKRSKVRYSDINWQGLNIGEIVSTLTHGKIRKDYFAHIDPDVCRGLLPRHQGWCPIFGQTGAAQGHLRNNSVGSDDLFLFWGLFREVEVGVNGYQFKREATPKHIIWGWLQVDRKVSVDSVGEGELEWAKYHPHFQIKGVSHNTVYIAKERLSFPSGIVSSCPGAGVFHKIKDKLILTETKSSKPSQWSLPSWFFPGVKKTPLTYHQKLQSWQIKGGRVLLNSTARGQEFILNCSEYPESLDWLRTLLLNA